MERGLYIAASGMLAEQVRQESLSNDLANVTTPGYKADRTSQTAFGQILTAAGGSLSVGAQVGAKVTDLRPGAISDTGEPLDFAIEGDGWFAVRTPQGERYTRGGSFAADAQGQLVDQLGNPVLGPDRQPVRVGADGTVAAGAVGAFTVTGITKAGDGLYTGQAGGAATGRVRTGALETSGADSTRTMVDLMASTRAFEAGARTLQTIDATLELAARQVGGMPG